MGEGDGAALRHLLPLDHVQRRAAAQVVLNCITYCAALAAGLYVTPKEGG